MKCFVFSITTLLLLGQTVHATERYILSEAGLWEHSLASFSLDSVSMSPLFEKARVRCPLVTDRELDLRVKMNVKYIFHNKLNRDRFLVVPSPEAIVDRMNKILELNAELHGLTDSGRDLLKGEPRPEKFAEVVEGIGKIAGELKKSFDGFFLDGGNSMHVFEFPQVEPVSAQFVHFILQSEKINKLLTARLDEFFFSPSPGAIALSDYRRSSIVVLSESLCKLSRLTGKGLADFSQAK